MDSILTALESAHFKSSTNGWSPFVMLAAKRRFIEPHAWFWHLAVGMSESIVHRFHELLGNAHIFCLIDPKRRKRHVQATRATACTGFDDRQAH